MPFLLLLLFCAGFCMSRSRSPSEQERPLKRAKIRFARCLQECAQCARVLQAVAAGSHGPMGASRLQPPRRQLGPPGATWVHLGAISSAYPSGCQTAQPPPQIHPDRCRLHHQPGRSRTRSPTPSAAATAATAAFSSIKNTCKSCYSKRRYAPNMATFVRCAASGSTCLSPGRLVSDSVTLPSPGRHPKCDEQEKE